MNRVTSVTEKTISEMVKNDMDYGTELAYMLQEMKSRYGCLGSTIKEMKKWDIELENQLQIGLYITNTIRGMGISFEKYITVVDCADLHHANIKDFNGLVKECFKSE